jgi:peptide-methionine (R)-S-oxide reductase
MNEKEWREKLGEEAFRVMRESGTERPFSSELNDHFEPGIYRCKGCGEPLYQSDAKFDGHCGWPSFDAPIAPDVVTEHRDLSHGMIRVEMRCAGCGSHLGHVFQDGPTATGLRHCVNGICLTFDPQGR